MTQEEKELLIKDLCGRIPYKVKGIITYNGDKDIFTVKGIFNILFLSDTECCKVEDFKPYLRPLSSMTENEREELKTLCDEDLNEFAGHIKKGHGLSHDGLYMFDKLRQLDWLNKKMFDYRGLIPKGLANEAPEGMYNS